MTRAVTRPETANAAMVAVILLVGITTLTSAQTTAMRWMGIAILVASAASG